MRQRLPLFAFALFACPAFAALNPAAVTVTATLSSKQSSKIDTKWADGTKDRTVSVIQTLQIQCRSMALARPEPARILWFFISKDPVNGKFEYQSKGSSDITVPINGAATVAAVADPITRRETYANRGPSRITAPSDPVPAGWIVTVLQGDRVINQTASIPGLLEWMRRNPPPKDGRS